MTLSIDTAIKILSRYDNEHYTPATRQAHRMGAEALAKDAVEVVRCKDCKHYKLLTDYRESTLPVCSRRKLNVEMQEEGY